MVLSLVFAIDNFLDGFGLVPVYKQAYGEPEWLYFFIFNSACVVLGALAHSQTRSPQRALRARTRRVRVPSAPGACPECAWARSAPTDLAKLNV